MGLFTAVRSVYRLSYADGSSSPRRLQLSHYNGTCPSASGRRPAYRDFILWKPFVSSAISQPIEAEISLACVALSSYHILPALYLVSFALRLKLASDLLCWTRENSELRLDEDGHLSSPYCLRKTEQETL
jgi:hypothetical protein